MIIPNYNHKPFLQERLNSVFNQTYQNFEVILLDDASTDDSVKVLKEYANHKKVSHFIINQSNSGSPFKQWYKGINLAIGDYIWIAESDDLCDLDFLEKQVDVLNHYDISVCKTLILSDNKKTDNELHNHFHYTYDTELLKPEHFTTYCPIANVSSVLFRSKILNKTKSEYTNFDVIGDYYFYFEHFLGRRIFYNLKTINYFRRNKESLSHLAEKDVHYFKKYFKEHLRLLKKIASLVTKEYKSEVIKSISRRYLKGRNRLSFKEKLSLSYLKIYLDYKMYLIALKLK